MTWCSSRAPFWLLFALRQLLYHIVHPLLLFPLLLLHFLHFPLLLGGGPVPVHLAHLAHDGPRGCVGCPRTVFQTYVDGPRQFGFEAAQPAEVHELKGVAR